MIKLNHDDIGSLSKIQIIFQNRKYIQKKAGFLKNFYLKELIPKKTLN
jgi:hypothetical protein